MWEYNNTPSSDELMHYGILGMKWGVRRSEAQLARARKRLKSKREVEDNASDDYKRARSKSTKEMSDVELQAAIRRLQMEKQYRDLNPPTVSRGKKITNTVMNAAGNVLLESGKQLAKDALVKKGKKLMGLDDKKDERSDFDKEFDALKKATSYATQKDLYKQKTGYEWSYMKK